MSERPRFTEVDRDAVDGSVDIYDIREPSIPYLAQVDPDEADFICAALNAADAREKAAGFDLASKPGKET